MSRTRSSFHKAHPQAGSRPGTLVIPPGSPKPALFLMRYSADALEERVLASPADIPASFSDGSVTWIDVRGYGDERVIRDIGSRFDLSALALEDAVNAPQRPKSEVYGSHHLVISRVPVVDGRGDMTMPQVCFVTGRNWLLTFQEQPFGFFEPVRERLRDATNRPIRTSGADYLTYALVDTMVDRYYPVLEGLSDALDGLEDQLLKESEDVTQEQLRLTRRRLVMIRRIAAPQCEMVRDLLQRPSPYLSDQVRTFLRDTLDHISQTAELGDALRETAGALSNEVLSMVAYRTNEVMKVLTLMASIFIPLTFIAGIYGMNFDNMPELRQHYGYAFALAIMASVAGGMTVYFRRRGWMGRRGRR